VVPVSCGCHIGLLVNDNLKLIQVGKPQIHDFHSTFCEDPSVGSEVNEVIKQTDVRENCDAISLFCTILYNEQNG
jgi:hypothetical protein